MRKYIIANNDSIFAYINKPKIDYSKEWYVFATSKQTLEWCIIECCIKLFLYMYFFALHEVTKFDTFSSEIGTTVAP